MSDDLLYLLLKVTTIVLAATAGAFVGLTVAGILGSLLT